MPSTSADWTDARWPVGRRSRDSQRLARHGDDLEIQHHLASRRPFERSAQPAGQLGVVGLPDLLTDLEPSQVDRLATEPQLDPTRALGVALDATGSLWFRPSEMTS